MLSAVYLSKLDLLGLPAADADDAHQSIFAGIAIAHQTGSIALLASVRSAFVSGMDVAFIVSAGVAVVGGILALVFIPRHTAESADEVAVVVSG